MTIADRDAVQIVGKCASDIHCLCGAKYVAARYWTVWRCGYCLRLVRRIG